MPGHLACKSVPESFAWRPLLGNLAWEPLGTFLGDLAWEPCLGTFRNLFLGTFGNLAWEPALGNLAWEPFGIAWEPLGFLVTFGNLLWEPCLGTWLGNLAWEPVPGNLGTLGIRILAAPTCSGTFTMAEDLKLTLLGGEIEN